MGWSSSALSLPLPCSSPKYDAEIKTAVKKYWLDFPRPEYWKAQLCQESHLDPNAKSPVGAEGLAQIMPATYADIIQTLHWDSAYSAYDPARAIHAGAWYEGTSRRFWGASGRTAIERNELGTCGYNAGNGNCVKAQKACNGAMTWDLISPCLQQITGKYAKETLTYVSNIRRYALEIVMP